MANLQIPVEENNSKLLCINTHRGLYKVDKLVLGKKVAPALFQQVMDTILGGFAFTFVYLDDIVISSKTKELHREHLNKVLAQIRGFGFRVKKAKCDFCMNKIWDISLTKTGDVSTPKGLQLSRIFPPLIMLRHYRASLDMRMSRGRSLRGER